MTLRDVFDQIRQRPWEALVNVVLIAIWIFGPVFVFWVAGGVAR